MNFRQTTESIKPQLSRTGESRVLNFPKLPGEPGRGSIKMQVAFANTASGHTREAKRDSESSKPCQ